MSARTVRVLRVIEYVGPEEWVRATLAKSLGGGLCIGDVANTVNAQYVREVYRSPIEGDDNASAPEKAQPSRPPSEASWRDFVRENDPRYHVGDDDEVP